MYKKILSLITLVLFAGIVSYFFYYNPHKVNLNLGSDSVYELPMALVLISSFFLGVIVLSLFAVFFGIKFKLEQWKLARKMKLQNSHYEDLKKAHDLIAINEADSAQALLQKIISKDPDDTLARLLLSKTYQIQERPKDALKTLEEARQNIKRTPALLIEAADAYIASGNTTAAFDSFLLALRDYPKNIFLLEKAVSLSRKLGKLGDARFLTEELMKVSPYAEGERISHLLGTISLDEISNLETDEPEKFKVELEKILKDNKDFIPAQLKYAELLFKRKESELAIKTLKKALTKYNSIDALNYLVQFWLSTDNPSMALEILKESEDSTSKDLSIAAKCLRAQTLLHLEHIEEAKIAVNVLEDLFAKDNEKSLFLLGLKAKLDSRIPGRSKKNLPLEKIILEEAEKSGLPSLESTIIHPNLEDNSKSKPLISLVK